MRLLGAVPSHSAQRGHPARGHRSALVVVAWLHDQGYGVAGRGHEGDHQGEVQERIAAGAIHLRLRVTVELNPVASLHSTKRQRVSRLLIAFNGWDTMRIATVGIHPEKAWKTDPVAACSSTPPRFFHTQPDSLFRCLAAALLPR